VLDVLVQSQRNKKAAKREIMPASSIVSTRGSTIGPRTPISRHGDENAR
jgi:hypothetical protein